MTEFEDNLWREVVREHGEDLARIDPTMTRRTPRTRTRARPRIVATCAAVIAAGGATAVLLSSAPASHQARHPAFAVAHGPNGATAVTFIDQTQPTASEIAAFNRALAAIGAHTGQTQTLVQTGTGLEVHCSDGQLIQTTSTTTPNGTRISWTCPGATSNTRQSTAPTGTGTD